MKSKIIFVIFAFFLFTNVKAETLEEKITNLKNKTDELEITDYLNNIYPVGSIYISTESTSPATLFGGTWTSYGEGKTLVGTGSNGTTSYTAGNTGGSSTKTLAITNIPSHNHDITPAGTVTSIFTGSQVTSSSSGGHTHTLPFKESVEEVKGYGVGNTSNYRGTFKVNYGDSYKSSTSSNSYNSTHTVTPTGTISSTFTGTSATTTSAGSGSAINIQNPYVVVYMWKRTA